MQTVEDMDGFVQQMQWSSDGASLAFEFSGNREGIFVIDADDTNLRQVHDEAVDNFDWYTE